MAEGFAVRQEIAGLRSELAKLGDMEDGERKAHSQGMYVCARQCWIMRSQVGDGLVLDACAGLRESVLEASGALVAAQHRLEQSTAALRIAEARHADDDRLAIVRDHECAAASARFKSTVWLAAAAFLDRAPLKVPIAHAVQARGLERRGSESLATAKALVTALRMFATLAARCACVRLAMVHDGSPWDELAALCVTHRAVVMCDLLGLAQCLLAETTSLSELRWLRPVASALHTGTLDASRQLAVMAAEDGQCPHRSRLSPRAAAAFRVVRLDRVAVAHVLAITS